MTTKQMLIAQYGTPLIPAKDVAQNFFSMDLPRFNEKVASGQIDLPIVTMYDSQKAPRFVHIDHLTAHIEKRRRAA